MGSSKLRFIGQFWNALCGNDLTRRLYLVFYKTTISHVICHQFSCAIEIFRSHKSNEIRPRKQMTTMAIDQIPDTKIWAAALHLPLPQRSVDLPASRITECAWTERVAAKLAGLVKRAMWRSAISSALNTARASTVFVNVTWDGTDALVRSVSFSLFWALFFTVGISFASGV